MYAGLTLSGSVGTTYEIQYSSDLNGTTWQPLADITLTNSPYLYFDTNSASASNRFYRAVVKYLVDSLSSLEVGTGLVKGKAAPKPTSPPVLDGGLPVISNCVNRAYAGSSPNGSIQSPFKTVTDGYQAALTSNTITIFNGNYNEAILMTKPLLLQATNGVVSLGIP
jgi:hypothetical protein